MAVEVFEDGSPRDDLNRSLTRPRHKQGVGKRESVLRHLSYRSSRCISLNKGYPIKSSLFTNISFGAVGYDSAIGSLETPTPVSPRILVQFEKIHCSLPLVFLVFRRIGIIAGSDGVFAPDFPIEPFCC